MFVSSHFSYLFQGIRILFWKYAVRVAVLLIWTKPHVVPGIVRLDNQYLTIFLELQAAANFDCRRGYLEIFLEFQFAFLGVLKKFTTKYYTIVGCYDIIMRPVFFLFHMLLHPSEIQYRIGQDRNTNMYNIHF